jgi:hypothetical protein
MKTLSTDWLEKFGNLPGDFGYIGARVFALGYPQGITSLWVTRSGKQTDIPVRGKLILVYGLIVPGNSGGPIVLPGTVLSAKIQRQG